MTTGRRLAYASLLTMYMLSCAPALAERCSMVGCGGQVFYLFLPDTQLTGGDKMRFGGHGQSCTAEGDQTFTQPGLPAVNAVAQMRADLRVLLSQQVVEANIDAFRPPRLDDESPTCKVVWSEPGNLGVTLDAGEKVRILGYRTFVQNYERAGRKGTRVFQRQVLFALVTVLD